MPARTGLSLVELLVVLAILGIVAGIGVVNGRRVLAGQQQRSAIHSIQQSVQQGATAAAARGREVRLVRAGRTLLVEEVDSRTRVRSEDLPPGVETNLPEGVVLAFTPPGRITAASLAALPDPLNVRTEGVDHRLRISSIGEVLAEATP